MFIIIIRRFVERYHHHLQNELRIFRYIYLGCFDHHIHILFQHHPFCHHHHHHHHQYPSDIQPVVGFITIEQGKSMARLNGEGTLIWNAFNSEGTFAETLLMILNQKLIKIIISKRHRKWGNLEVAVKQVSTERRGFNTLLRNFSKENLSEVFAIQQFGQSKTCPIKCCCCC